MNKNGAQTQRRERELPIYLRNSVIILLTSAAGGIDVISFMSLGGVFVANMSGSIILLGLGLGSGQFPLAIRAAVSLSGYCLGVILATMLVRKKSVEGNWSFALSAALLLEVLLLGCFTLLLYVQQWVGVRVSGYGLLWLGAFCMAIQTATAMRLRIAGISTTYFSGALTRLIVESMQWVTWRWRISSGRGNANNHTAPDLHLRIQWFAICTYVLSAGLSALIGTHWSGVTIYFPLFSVVSAVLIVLIGYRSR